MLFLVRMDVNIPHARPVEQGHESKAREKASSPRLGLSLSTQVPALATTSESAVRTVASRAPLAAVRSLGVIN